MSANIEFFPAQRVIHGVTVVYAVELLDFLFPAGWTQMRPQLYLSATASWLCENDALHFAWIGAASERLEKEKEAVEQAKTEGRKVVLIDPLYRSICSA